MTIFNYTFKCEIDIIFKTTLFPTEYMKYI